jgi:hypothetical protein
MSSQPKATAGRRRPVEKDVAKAAARARQSVQRLEMLRGHLHQRVKDLLPLYEEFQQAVEEKRMATREYIRLTGDELSFGGYFDYRESPLSFQDLKADAELFRMVKALRFCRACKIT